MPLFALAGKDETDSLGTISGVVFTSDGQAAPYVTVLLKNKSKATIADTKGKFEFKKVKTGNYILSVSLLGYIPTEIAVEVKQNKTARLKIQLQITYAELLEVIVKANAGSKYIETKTSEGLRVNLPIVELPQNIIVTTCPMLADQGLLSTSEAIRNVSGIQKNNSSINDCFLNIRGTDATYNMFRNGTIQHLLFIQHSHDNGAFLLC